MFLFIFLLFMEERLYLDFAENGVRIWLKNDQCSEAIVVFSDCTRRNLENEKTVEIILFSKEGKENGTVYVIKYSVMCWNVNT